MTTLESSSNANPLLGWHLDEASISYVGSDLQRPECILAERSGDLWAADARGGVMQIKADGTQTLITQVNDGHFNLDGDAKGSLVSGTLPNGLAFDRNGDILISNFGTDRLELMDRRSGVTRILKDEIDGLPLGKVNFVLRDSRDRIWMTISTRINPWTDAIRQNVSDGYIALIDESGIRVVADGFSFTNEIRLDAREEWLYVAETCGKRVTRLRVSDDGSLTDREIYGPDNLGTGLVDGICFDAYGNLWVTMIFADRLIAITPDRQVIEIADLGNADKTRDFEAAFATGEIVPFDILYATGGTVAPWLASVTFGGADLRTVYLGSLRATRIASFSAPVAGLPMAHW